MIKGSSQIELSENYPFSATLASNSKTRNHFVGKWNTHYASATMYIKSPYPDIPNSTEGNVHYALFQRPDQAQWPEDFTLHIDARTGKKRTYREFLERIRLGATAIGGPVSEGGLGLQGEDGELVGIMGWNSSVGFVSIIEEGFQSNF